MTDGLTQLGQQLAKVPALLVEIYGDLARPGVKQVGKALETVLTLSNTLLLPIEWINDASRIILKRNLERFRINMESVSELDTVTASPEIGVPIVEKLSYVQDPTLADMYVSLLTKASTQRMLRYSHPGFTGIVNSLSPDEANIIHNFDNFWQIPIVVIRSYSRSTPQYVFPNRMNRNLVFKENWSAYISNLRELELMVVKHGVWRTEEMKSNWWAKEDTDAGLVADITSVLKEKEVRESLQSSPDFAYGYLELTEFGRLFQTAVRMQ